jgi:ribosomal protein L11 methyltransferase
VASYVIELFASEEQKDLLLAELMDAGTTGVSENDLGAGQWLLRASFDAREQAAAFGVAIEYDDTDWIAATHRPWAPRLVGERFFFAAEGDPVPTPAGRWRIAYQQGAACGSGEHPSTRQALEALEEFLRPGMRVLDLGCGAGLLSHGAKLLGAGFVAGVDIEEDSCALTRKLAVVPVVQGSADCLRGGFDVVVANIGATVLAYLADDLLRLAERRLILAGFGVEEAARLKELFGPGDWSERCEGEWSCLVLDREDDANPLDKAGAGAGY